MLEDRVLILKFKTGCSDALKQIYEKYRNDLLKLAIVMTNDINTAEDVVQDAFVNFARVIDTIKPHGNLKQYLMTSVANRIRNRLRDTSRHPTCSDENLDKQLTDSDNPERWAVLSEQLQLICDAMAQIPPDQRQTIGLRLQGDMTFRQIAKIQNASINTIQGHYRYGIKKLRTLLNSEVAK
ncbi:MAG: RNA polymerase sigma factor [Planctomycetota bacterium]|jgi:RNA polymerase sigma factor (sigma-70 family)